jgi:hypothetical protein
MLLNHTKGKITIRKTYLGLEINRRQSGLIIRRRDFIEGRLNRKRLINPYTIDGGEARPTGRCSVFEDDGKEMRDERVEMIGGFESEEVEKLLSCGTLRASSDDTKHNL